MQNEITGDITPLNWDVVKSPTNHNQFWIAKGLIEVADLSNQSIGASNEANATYIVKACNLFPELVEALEEMHNTFYDEEVNHYWQKDILTKAKALIQKAKI